MDEFVRDSKDTQNKRGACVKMQSIIMFLLAGVVSWASATTAELWISPTGTFAPRGLFGEENDLRYFPVNLCGWSKTAHNFCPKDTFPEAHQNLGGIMFHLVNPDENAGRSVLILKPGEEARIHLKDHQKRS